MSIKNVSNYKIRYLSNPAKIAICFSDQRIKFKFPQSGLYKVWSQILIIRVLSIYFINDKIINKIIKEIRRCNKGLINID